MFSRLGCDEEEAREVVVTGAADRISTSLSFKLISRASLFSDLDISLLVKVNHTCDVTSLTCVSDSVTTDCNLEAILLHKDS